MLKLRIPEIRNQTLIGVIVFGLGLCLACLLGRWILENDRKSLIFAALGLTACAIALSILRNWRAGFYFFFGWLMFEDLVRKYMGNNLALFFGKDVLLALVYVALFREIGRGREKTFRPPFLLFVALFFWLGVLQIFNPNSPSILFGLLGLKLYFYYVPLMFAGYALIRCDEDLRKFLVVNAVIAGVIGGLGIAQAILGNSFLNPSTLAPELQELGDLTKVTPITGLGFNLPDSVFVSSGRFDEYLTVALILAIGSAAYLLYYRKRGRTLALSSVGILGAATLLSGAKSSAVAAFASLLVLSIGFLWGAPWRHGQAHRIIRAVRRSAIVMGLGLVMLILIFPEKAGSRLAYYTETLDPSSAAYQLGARSWAYPIGELQKAIAMPNWAFGNGIGTASLGVQYVDKVIGQHPDLMGVEEGYGQMLIEMGIVAPFLWLLWTAALLYYAWKVVRRLRGTRFFPIAGAILWYAFFLLYPFTYVGLDSYQDYICNFYLWLLVGILFRLPDIVANEAAPIFVTSRPIPNLSDVAQNRIGG